MLSRARGTARRISWRPQGRTAQHGRARAHLVFVHAPHHDDIDLDCRGWGKANSAVQCNAGGENSVCMRADRMQSQRLPNKQTMEALILPLPPCPRPAPAGRTWVEAQRQRLLDGSQHALVAVAPRHRQEAVGAQRVQRDVEKRQACVWCVVVGGWRAEGGGERGGGGVERREGRRERRGRGVVARGGRVTCCGYFPHDRRCSPAHPPTDPPTCVFELLQLAPQRQPVAGQPHRPHARQRAEA